MWQTLQGRNIVGAALPFNITLKFQLEIMHRFWRVGVLAIPTAFLAYHVKRSNHAYALSASKQQTNDLSWEKPKTAVIDTQIDYTKKSIGQSIQDTKRLVELFRVQTQVPGMSVAVAHKGRLIWSQGFGFCDLENGTRCRDNSVMRIASISKCITSALVARLVDQGKLDLDRPIHEYLGDKFPIKKVDNTPVEITLRHLLTHTGGIRHYHVASGQKELESAEYYVTEYCDNAYDSLKYFKDDDLLHKPGHKFSYTTYGFSLIGAVIQSVLEPNESLEQALIDMCKNDLGMLNTYLDKHKPLIANRSHYYYKRLGKLNNVPYVDNSYKWAGGGLLSNVIDLTRFANALIASYKTDRGFIRQETMSKVWAPLVHTNSDSKNAVNKWNKYGLGWFVVKDVNLKYKDAAAPPFDQYMYHTGAAIGATSILLILPEEELVIAVLTNLDSCGGLSNLAFNIASTFKKSI